MNAAPDLCCYKYRPACSDDCPLSLIPYTATIGICTSDYSASDSPTKSLNSPNIRLADQLLRTKRIHVPSSGLPQVPLFFRVILCTMAPYLLLASWKVVDASSTTAGLTEFISQRNPVLDFVLSHASGFAKWTAQPREPRSGRYEIMLIWLTQIQRHSSSSPYGGSHLPLS